jgi:hypothetical protein
MVWLAQPKLAKRSKAGGVRSQIRTGLRSKFRDPRELTGQIREFGPFLSAAGRCNPVLLGLSDENSRVALTGIFDPTTGKYLDLTRRKIGIAIVGSSRRADGPR